jgi:hypothetical protein
MGDLHPWHCAQAQRTHCADADRSMISDLVCNKAAEVMNDINRLLEKDAFEDPDKWGRAWHLIAEPVHMDEAKVLMLTLVHQMAAEWQMRFVSVVSKFPLKFLVCLEAPHHVSCKMRQEVADSLLQSCDVCLHLELSDFTWKAKHIYRQDFEHMRCTGQCTLGLYILLLSLRSVLHGDTQEVEGWNSVLQTMTRRARRMGISLANARLNLKHGSPITPEDCCSAHSAVLELMATPDYSHRFEPLPNTAAHIPPADPAPTSCVHQASPSLQRAACLSAAVKTVVDTGAGYVYMLDTIGGNHLGAHRACFLAVWTYWSTVWCTVCDISDNRLEVKLPMRPVKLLFVIDEALRFLISKTENFLRDFKVDSVDMSQHRLKWQTPCTATLIQGSQRRLSVRARKPQAKKKAKADPAPDDGPVATAVDLDMDADAEGLLEEMLADVLEAAEAEHEAEAIV